MKKVDFLIIGQGLAGTCMAIELLRNNLSFQIIDNGKKNASTTANGIINPVTGQRFVKSWNYDLFLPFAKALYNYWEEHIKSKFFFERTILKLLPTALEANLYDVKVGMEGYEILLPVTKNEHPLLKAEYTGMMKGGFYLNCKEFTHCSREYFLSSDSLTEKTFDIDDVIVQENGFAYEDLFAEHIVFCQGYTADENPFFPHLPFVPTKGQIIQVKMDNFTSDTITQKNGILSPLEDGSFLMGATYEWAFTDDEPNEEGKTVLLEKLKQMINDYFTILQHTAAIRPTTKDRKPLIGRSERHPNAYILNGLGTKGVLMAPYLAQQVRQMAQGSIVPDDIIKWNRS